MSSTRSSGAAQAELEALLLPAGFVDCVVARRQRHPVAVACARIRPVGPAGAAPSARLN
jgi:hypothetical protein